MQPSPFWEDGRQVYPGSPPCSSDAPPTHTPGAGSEFRNLAPRVDGTSYRDECVCDQQLP